MRRNVIQISSLFIVNYYLTIVKIFHFSRLFVFIHCKLDLKLLFETKVDLLVSLIRYQESIFLANYFPVKVRAIL